MTQGETNEQQIWFAVYEKPFATFEYDDVPIKMYIVACHLP